MAVSEEPIKIVAVKGGRAKIVVRRFTLCAHCHLEDGLFVPSIFEIWVDNKISARPGEMVHVQMAPKKFLLGVFILFAIPLLGLFAGIATVYALHLAHSLAAQIIGATFGYAVSYLLVWRLDRYVLKSNKFIPAVAKIVRVKQNLIAKPIG
ncbi:hypothetical protein B6D60_04465 [candidate division KSB1 bacterium 4484_87]|nr:MAG: hypothetical protein B6D60_04465 [candidate division KSB1 bacterium 4484_87]